MVSKSGLEVKQILCLAKFKNVFQENNVSDKLAYFTKL